MYGFPDECHKFDQRHPLWNEMMANLVKALDIAFTRTQMMDNNADRFVYFFGRVILEDFMEIALVSYHGYGIAASKLVRSMYEFTVTMHYLHEHPDEAETPLLINRGSFNLSKPKVGDEATRSRKRSPRMCFAIDCTN